jgi:fructose-1-phosphate kinase PfkB-like protein
VIPKCLNALTSNDIIVTAGSLPQSVKSAG